MRLRELQPQFVRRGTLGMRQTQSFELADGISFNCPDCQAHGRPDHLILIWFRGTGAWEASGTGYEDLTLAPSIRLSGPCSWHGFVKDGEIR